MKLRLTIEVEYDENGVDEETLTQLLYDIANRAGAHGGFTGDYEAEVYSWLTDVKRVDGSRWWYICTDRCAERPSSELIARTRVDALAEALKHCWGTGYVTDVNPNCQIGNDRNSDERYGEQYWADTCKRVKHDRDMLRQRYEWLWANCTIITWNDKCEQQFISNPGITPRTVRVAIENEMQLTTK